MAKTLLLERCCLFLLLKIFNNGFTRIYNFVLTICFIAFFVAYLSILTPRLFIQLNSIFFWHRWWSFFNFCKSEKRKRFP